MGKNLPDRIEKVDKPEEACGVFGILAPRKQVAKLSYYALLALQHRGQESAGIAAFDFNHFKIHKDMGLVHEVFNERILSELNGHIAVAHTRYSTMGSSNIDNAQPFEMNTKIGHLALAHNGNLVNAIDLRKRLQEKGCSLYTTSDSEIILNLVNNFINEGNVLEEAIVKALKLCNGAFSIIIGSKDRLLAARDPNGIRPLCLGVTVGGDFVVSSETCALDIIDAKFVREITPGELISIDLNKTINSFDYSPLKKSNLCLFEIIYFARPDSVLYDKSVYNFRFNLGQTLAKISHVMADIVIPIPDSGTIAAIGYSYASGIPLAKGLIKNRNVGRTFIEPTPEMREQGIKLKLNPIKDIIRDKRIILVDDSIVRGTTSKQIVKMLRKYEAKEIHFRVASAPIKFPCFYGIDTDESRQLVASNLDNDGIRDYIQADSLEYLSVEKMIKSCNDNSYCSACFTGNYPVDMANYNTIKKEIFEKQLVLK